MYSDLYDLQLDLLFALPPSLTNLYAKAFVSLANNLNCCGVSSYRDWINLMNNRNYICWFRVKLKRRWLSNFNRPYCIILLVLNQGKPPTLLVNLLASPQLENIQLDIWLMGVLATMSLPIVDLHALDLKPYMFLKMCLVSILTIESEGL